MRLARVLGSLVLVSLVAGVSIAGAGPKFASSETIEFPGGNLIVTFEEGGQKRFSLVDYELTATAVATHCQTFSGETVCVAGITQPSASVSGLVPDDKGRVAASVTITVNESPGGTLCGCSLRMDYSDITLTNLASGHVYRLDPISADAP